MQAQETLRKYFGHEAFRPGQEVMVNALTHHRDALGVMPTGAGKSMCYQVPALMLPGVAIVISPLISLMADQVAALKSAGVPAAYLNSSLTPRQMELAMQRARQGAYKSSTSPRSASKRPRFRRWRNPCRFLCLPWMRRTASPSGGRIFARCICASRISSIRCPPARSWVHSPRPQPSASGKISSAYCACKTRKRSRPALTARTSTSRSSAPKTAMLPSWTFSAGNAAKAASFTVQRAKRSNRSATS